MGYQKSGSSNFKKDKGVENASNITMIKVVDMMLAGSMSVIAIGHVVPGQFAGGRKIRRTVVIEDTESNQLDCTFWEHWATMSNESAQKRNELGHMVFILQLGKVKYSDGTPTIHNALFGTKMFINCDVPQIISFFMDRGVHASRANCDNHYILPWGSKEDGGEYLRI
uniref:Replication protein A 70 kDa DNA-binding subunit B n=1 Tax=Tanacetum cinerariifolium TaxID=118510 RepID=A0A699I0D5_TANCI|nr:replication protein A 70 kDa DNA-binding subunit B [Tanacetum cinerariifolium]